MRLDAVRVSNFRGIELAEMSGVADSALVTVSGPNGAGKSLLFEAIALFWRFVPFWERQQITPPAVIGPWDDACQVEISVVLADEERASLAEYLASVGDLEPDARGHLGIRVTRDQQVQLTGDRWAQPLLSADFTSAHPFANVDYFPADRAFQRGEQASVNPAMLSEQQREGFRDQIVGSFVQQRQLVNLSGIAPLLASLDYVDLLAEREGKPQTGDFDILADALEASTSKNSSGPFSTPSLPMDRP